MTDLPIFRNRGSLNVENRQGAFGSWLANVVWGMIRMKRGFGFGCRLLAALMTVSVFRAVRDFLHGSGNSSNRQCGSRLEIIRQLARTMREAREVDELRRAEIL